MAAGSEQLREARLLMLVLVLVLVLVQNRRRSWRVPGISFGGGGTLRSQGTGGVCTSPEVAKRRGQRLCALWIRTRLKPLQAPQLCDGLERCLTVYYYSTTYYCVLYIRTATCQKTPPEFAYGSYRHVRHIRDVRDVRDASCQSHHLLLPTPRYSTYT
jgi:hypothetical protein